MEKGKAVLLKKIPRPLFFIGGLFLLCLLLHLFSALFTPVADFAHRYVAAPVRALLGYITGLFPFSLAEWVILLIPLWLFLLVFCAVKAARSGKATKRMIAVLLALLMVFYVLFVLTLGLGYLTTPLDGRLALPEVKVNAASLYQTAEWLLEEIERVLPQSIGEEGSLLPYSYAEMNSALRDGYRSLKGQYSFLSTLEVGTKPILASHPMAYTGITGIYTFFTGEANVNTVYPDYATVFTAAHEMAHQRGISREDEANFVAFLACAAAEDPYIRYAGHLNLFQYVYNALYSADKALALSLPLPDGVKKEFNAYNAVYDKYDNTGIGAFSEAVNNVYLEAMGTEGVVSYGLVVNLAVAYRDSLLADK